MCGLGGWTRDTRAPLTRNDVSVLRTAQKKIMEAIERRGDHSWGVAADFGDHILHLRGLGGITMAPIPDLTAARSVLLHGRYATKGAITPANAHPFDLGNGWFGAHNGIISEHPLLDCYPVDSLSALHALAEGEDLSDAEGYGTFVLMRGGRILIFRGPSGAIEIDTVSLHKGKVNVFCSVLPWLVKDQMTVGDCIRLVGDYHGKDKRKISMKTHTVAYSEANSYGFASNTRAYTTPWGKCATPGCPYYSENPTKPCWHCAHPPAQRSSNLGKKCAHVGCEVTTWDSSGACFKHSPTGGQTSHFICTARGCMETLTPGQRFHGKCSACLVKELDIGIAASRVNQNPPERIDMGDGTEILCGQVVCRTCGCAVKECGSDCPRQPVTPHDSNVVVDGVLFYPDPEND